MATDSDPEKGPRDSTSRPPSDEICAIQGTTGSSPEPATTQSVPLSRTALKALRLKPAPGQQPAQRIWSRRRREYIELFDPALCAPMREARALSAAQRAALQARRLAQTQADCASCGRSLARAQLNRQGLCSACISALESEQADMHRQERRDTLCMLIDAAPPGRTLYLDTETTGLSAASGDELLELALIDDAGTVLIDTLVRPARHTEWPGAQAIHGISPTDVAGAPTLETVLPSIAAAIEGAEALVIFNADFDLGFLPETVHPLAKQKACCAMQAFALWWGEWDDFRGAYRWQSLQQAATIAGHVWDGRAHRARSDALAVRAIWQWLRAVVATGS